METDNRRILLAAAISAAILVLWQVVFPTTKQGRRAPAGGADAGQVLVPEKAPAATTAGAPPVPVAVALQFNETP